MRKTALRECWGVGSIDCYEDFLALEEKLLAADASMLDYHMERLNVKAMVSDIYDFNEFAGYLEGVTPHSKYARFSLNTGFFNDLHRYEDLFLLQKYLKKKITCLDDYLECFDNFLKRCVDFGIVALKVIAAYRRSLDFANPPKSEAESVFNEMTRNPRIIFGDEVVRPLDEWLFHYLMRKAAEYNLPVQVHAGYLAADNPRNIITDANAVNLTKTVELHKDVSFSLFHGNWPYMGEFLYMGKNYPNVHLDLCFTQNMDPPYCVELMKRAVMTVPHYKLHAFGGDMGRVDFVTAYLGLARDNVACALSELVESGWLDLGEAKQIAADWFFNNPNEFYSLGFDRITV
ncbi:MAG: amidohydrolase [Defluviitaleaceae bacterium]|nr:amidohydrolase [Defluviitaleaceae bacterium]